MYVGIKTKLVGAAVGRPVYRGLSPQCGEFKSWVRVLVKPHVFTLSHKPQICVTILSFITTGVNKTF